MWNELKEAVEKSGKTMSQLANESGGRYTMSVLSNWILHDGYDKQTLAIFSKVCDQLGVSPNVLLGWGPDKAAPDKEEPGLGDFSENDLCEVLAWTLQKEAELRKKISSGYIDTNDVEEINRLLALRIRVEKFIKMHKTLSKM